ncbi:MAG: RHS domain-containing protein, partial [Proteobacteria bacterium]|nr:RHS domain-containing protein [Pseudomonadota bacterium]
FERDIFGNITTVFDPLNRKTQYIYDEAHRLTRIIKPTGTQITCAYDAENRLIRHTDEAGNTTKLTYTGLGKIKTRTNPDGSVVHYDYDTEEQLKTLTNERGEIYEFKRDHQGRIINEIDYWGNERKYVYDPAGQLLESIDPLNRITTFKTDVLGRLIEKSFDDGKTETFAFDPNGNLIAHENGHAKTERIFDHENRLISESLNGQIITHDYDVLGNRTRRLSALGNDIRFSHDTLGRTTGITINGSEMQIARNTLGLPTKETFFNGTKRTYNYTADNQLAEQVVILPRGNTIERSYEYDPVGNLTARIDADKGSRYFTYNPMGRITKYIDPEQKIREFLHDPAGDLFKRSEKEAFDGSWYLEHDGTDYHFNAAGNLIERKSDKQHQTFDWDCANRLTASTNETTSQTTTFSYDALGRRLSKKTDDQATTFLWDGDQLLSDNVGGRNSREFVYYPGSFEPLAIIDQNKTINLVHTDSVGLPQEVTNESGDLVWSASYNAQGAVETLHASAYDNPIRMQGQYADPETGLYYNRHRYFDPGTATFISQDPLGLAAGENVYDYSPNVWGWIDPLGLCKDPASKKLPSGNQKYNASVYEIETQTGLSRGGRQTQIGEIKARHDSVNGKPTRRVDYDHTHGDIGSPHVVDKHTNPNNPLQVNTSKPRTPEPGEYLSPVLSNPQTIGGVYQP